MVQRGANRHGWSRVDKELRNKRSGSNPYALIACGSRNQKSMVGATGFEPVTTRTPSVCATRLRYAPTAVKVAVTLTSRTRQINLMSPGRCLLVIFFNHIAEA